MNLPSSVKNLLHECDQLPARDTFKEGPALLTQEAPLSNEATESLVNWILEHEEQHQALAEWLNFLRQKRSQFTSIVEQMGRWNESSSHSLGHDKWNVGWGGDALLPHANTLYSLHSYEVTGRVLECGAFKGSSTACLSLVCKELGFELDCADSFEGLPSEEGHYQKGDFLGSLEEVKENVTRFGEIDSVNFIQGWYADSLKNYTSPIALLWLDVDLQESTLDVLNNVYMRLAPNGIILSDGFTDGVDFEGQQIAQTGGEPAGFYRYFQENSLSYCATPGGSKGLAQIATPSSDECWKFYLPSIFLPTLLERL